MEAYEGKRKRHKSFNQKVNEESNVMEQAEQGISNTDLYLFLTERGCICLNMPNHQGRWPPYYTPEQYEISFSFLRHRTPFHWRLRQEGWSSQRWSQVRDKSSSRQYFASSSSLWANISVTLILKDMVGKEKIGSVKNYQKEMLLSSKRLPVLFLTQFVQTRPDKLSPSRQSELW